MRGKIRFLGLATILAVGVWAPAFGQTGDCYNQYPGCLDINFGVNGKLTLPQGMSVAGLAVQYIAGEPRIIVASGTPGTKKAPGAWVVYRYLSNGELDPSFGTGGMAKMTFSKNSNASKIAVQPDNKLLVVGNAPSVSGHGNISCMPTVARYNVNGSLDMTFGKGGLAQVPCLTWPSTGGTVQTVILQSNGKIVIAAQHAWPGRLVLSRLNTNGSFDTTFNGTGQYLNSIPSIAFGLATQWIDSEERIVASGGINGKAAIWRFTGNGSLDTSLAGSGILLVDYGQGNDGYGELAVDSSNRLVVVAGADDLSGNSHYMIVRYNPNGDLDATFGTGGRLFFQAPGAAGAVEIQSDGKILVGGWSGSYVAVWRFDDTGLPDTSFGVQGWITTDFGATSVSEMVQQSDGKFYLAAGGTFARYWK